MNNKNLKWGIKTEGGYVNFIHGTLKNIYEFETSQDINDICIFSEVAAHAYSQKIKGIAFPIVLSEQPKLSIPKWVADIFDEFLKDDYDWHDFEMSFVGVDDDDDGLERKFFDWTNSENATELTLAYLNPLTRPFVEVEG